MRAVAKIPRFQQFFLGQAADIRGIAIRTRVPSGCVGKVEKWLRFWDGLTDLRRVF